MDTTSHDMQPCIRKRVMNAASMRPHLVVAAMQKVVNRVRSSEKSRWTRRYRDDRAATSTRL